MPYDDPKLKEFDGYFEAKKPGVRERAENWAISIGLQKAGRLRRVGPDKGGHWEVVAS